MRARQFRLAAPPPILAVADEIRESGLLDLLGEREGNMAQSSNTTGTAFDRFFSEMIDHPERYCPLLLSIEPGRKQEFEDHIVGFTSHLLDATSRSFQAVFPPDIMGEGQHLILAIISQQQSAHPDQVYRTIGSSACRRLLFSVDVKRLSQFDEMLKSYLTVSEAHVFDRWSRQQPLFLPPKAGSFGVLVLRGIRPESEVE